MTRDEAIEYLYKLYMKAEITDEYGDMDDTEPYEEAIDMAIEALNAKRWIPVSERLPDLYAEVIVSDDSIVFTALRTNINNGEKEDEYHWEDIEDRMIVHPDAWMTLPEPFVVDTKRGDEE